MNKFLLLIFCAIPFTLFSQTFFTTEKEALSKFPVKDVYKCNNGWILRRGDTLQLGKGSMPDKTFAFITENANPLYYHQYSDHTTGKLQHTYNGRIAEIVDFYIVGSRKMGYYISARVKVGQLSRYNIDLENAIEAGEVKAPPQFVPKPDNAAGNPIVSKADEIKKLKDLLDAGALTQQEFDNEKKKILDSK